MLPYYYSLNEYLLQKYNQKVYKLALNGGMSCPNRDGLIDTRGCILCSSGGSGEFTGDQIKPAFSITEQINNGIELLANKYFGDCYIAYFQSFTNTYAPVEYLRKIFTEAIMHPKVVCLSIATRPDCLDDDIIELLEELNQIKPVWIELGLQTIHQNTANYIRRGYSLQIFEDTLEKLNHVSKPFNIIVHMIIGLPGETPQDMYDTANYLAHCKIEGIKLQLLHVLKGTDLAIDYENQLFSTLSLEEYTTILGNIIKILPSNMVIHRLTGDGAKKLLIAPLWSSKKKNVLNTIHSHFRNENIIQGSKSTEVYHEHRSNDLI